MRSTQPFEPDPSSVKHMAVQPAEYTGNQTMAKNVSLVKGLKKSLKKGSMGLITMSKVDSQLSIQNEVVTGGGQHANAHSISELPYSRNFESNRNIPQMNLPQKSLHSATEPSMINIASTQ